MLLLYILAIIHVALKALNYVPRSAVEEKEEKDEIKLYLTTETEREKYI